MPTDTQTLIGEANCYFCFGQVSPAQGLKLALLARTLLALSPAADTSPQALLDYAKCFACFTEGTFAELMELALLDQMSQAL
jgi:hypothetical protein